MDDNYHERVRALLASQGEPADLDTPERVRALLAHLNLDDPDDLEELSYGLFGMGVSYRGGGGDYAVMTDDEADAAWEESLDSYLDEVVIPEVPDEIGRYFDREQWKEDARYDGRGQSLSSYDGDEHEVEDPETGETFYIYREN